MPEVEKPAAGAGDGAGEGQAGAEGDQNNNSAGAGADEGDKGAGEKKEGDGGSPDNGGKPKPPEENPAGDDKEEPAVRKRLSTQDFIIGRQRAKIAKENAKKDDDDGAGDGKKDDETDEDDDIAPEDEAMISKVVAKRFAPIIDKSLAADDDKEVTEFVKTNPDFKPYEAKARRFMNHPSRRSLPIEAIFYEVAGKDLIKIGAERQKAADEKAKASQTGGGSNRAGEGAKNVWDMTPDEFAQEQQRVLRGK